jgi:hypothetical protein
MKTLRALKFAGMGVLMIGGISLLIFITMSLWNCLIPLLFHGPVITFWQTAGLIVLSKILLSGFAPGGGRRHYRRHEHFCAGEYRANREDWWKKFNDMKKGKDDTSKVE